MQTSYEQGAVVRVFDTPGNRARAEHGEAGIPSRAATIARQMPYEDAYEVTFADGGEPATQILTVEYLLPADE